MNEAERLRKRLRYDPETGALTWLIGTSKGPAGSAAGWRDPDGYLMLRFEKRLHPAHRLIWLYMTGAWPEGLVDHRDTDPTNNKWSNLRDVTKRTNQENRRAASKHNKSGLLGVSTLPHCFVAKIESRGRVHYLGRHKTAEAAHAAYVKAKRELHEGCTL